MGERLPKCDADQMGVLRAESLPTKLRQLLEPLLKEVESLTEKIKDSDREIEQIARKDYPETALLQQVGQWANVCQSVMPTRWEFYEQSPCRQSSGNCWNRC